MRVLREEMRWEERFIRWSARFAIVGAGVVHGEVAFAVLLLGTVAESCFRGGEVEGDHLVQLQYQLSSVI